MRLTEKLSLLSGGPTITPSSPQLLVEENSASLRHAIILQRFVFILNFDATKDNSKITALMNLPYTLPCRLVMLHQGFDCVVPPVETSGKRQKLQTFEEILSLPQLYT